MELRRLNDRTEDTCSGNQWAHVVWTIICAMVPEFSFSNVSPTWRTAISKDVPPQQRQTSRLNSTTECDNFVTKASGLSTTPDNEGFLTIHHFFILKSCVHYGQHIPRQKRTAICDRVTGRYDGLTKASDTPPRKSLHLVASECNGRCSSLNIFWRFAFHANNCLS